MSPDVWLLIILAVPVLLIMLLRANGALVFLSACLGAVLLNYVGPDAGTFTRDFVTALNGNNLKLALLLLPVVLTTVFMIKTVRGSQLAFNFLPALGTALLLALLAVPLLPASFAINVVTSSTWHQLRNLETLIIGASAVVCLMFIWMQRPKSHDDKHGKHHK